MDESVFMYIKILFRARSKSFDFIRRFQNKGQFYDILVFRFEFAFLKVGFRSVGILYPIIVLENNWPLASLFGTIHHSAYFQIVESPDANVLLKRSKIYFLLIICILPLCYMFFNFFFLFFFVFYVFLENILGKIKIYRYL